MCSNFIFKEFLWEHEENRKPETNKKRWVMAQLKEVVMIPNWWLRGGWRGKDCYIFFVLVMILYFILLLRILGWQFNWCLWGAKPLRPLWIAQKYILISIFFRYTGFLAFYYHSLSYFISFPSSVCSFRLNWKLHQLIIVSQQQIKADIASRATSSFTGTISQHNCFLRYFLFYFFDSFIYFCSLYFLLSWLKLIRAANMNQIS